MADEQAVVAPMLDVTVDRAQWYRGKGSHSSRLLLTYQTDGMKENDPRIGKMCCLGFACLAAGLTEAQIANHGFPNHLANKWRQTGAGPLPASLLPLCRAAADGYIGTSQVCSDIGGANDSTATKESDRERQLTELGKKAGINFTFIGG